MMYALLRVTNSLINRIAHLARSGEPVEGPCSCGVSESAVRCICPTVTPLAFIMPPTISQAPFSPVSILFLVVQFRSFGTNDHFVSRLEIGNPARTTQGVFVVPKASEAQKGELADGSSTGVG